MGKRRRLNASDHPPPAPTDPEPDGPPAVYFPLIRLKGVPLTRSHHLETLVTFVRQRPVTQYWTHASGELFSVIPKPVPGVQAKPYSPCGQATWFRSTLLEGSHHDNPLPGLHVEIEPEAGSLEFIRGRNEVEAERVEKADRLWAGKRLTGELRVTADQKVTMTEEDHMAFDMLKEYERHKILQERGERDCVMRTVLFQLHGSKAQFEHLRQQRGVCRHLYNLCVNATREGGDVPDGNVSALKRRYCNDPYWVNSGKLWGKVASNNLRDATIRSFASALSANKKKSAQTGRPFTMKYQTLKHDRVNGFQIPVHKDQILEIGTRVPRAQRHVYKQKHHRPLRKKGKGVRKRGQFQQTHHDQGRVDVVFRYSGSPQSFTVRLPNREAADRFVQDKADLVEREGSVRIVCKGGRWYLALTLPHERNVVPSVSAYADSVGGHAEAICMGAFDEQPIPVIARVAAVDPGIASFATAYFPVSGDVVTYGSSPDSLKRIRDTSSTLSTHAKLHRLAREESRIWGQLAYDRQKASDLTLRESVRKKISRRADRVQHRRLGRLRRRRVHLVRELHNKVISVCILVFGCEYLNKILTRYFVAGYSPEIRHCHSTVL